MWAITCSLSSIDQQKNNVSLFEVIDQVNLPREAFGEKPRLVNVKHEVISQWRRVIQAQIDSSELIFDVAIELVDPQGKSIQRAVSQYSLPKGMRRLRIRTGFGALAVTCPGDYAYKVSYKLTDDEDFQPAHTIHLEVLELSQ